MLLLMLPVVPAYSLMTFSNLDYSLFPSRPRDTFLNYFLPCSFICHSIVIVIVVVVVRARIVVVKWLRWENLHVIVDEILKLSRLNFFEGLIAECCWSAAELAASPSTASTADKLFHHYRTILCAIRLMLLLAETSDNLRAVMRNKLRWSGRERGRRYNRGYAELKQFVK